MHQVRLMLLEKLFQSIVASARASDGDEVICRIIKTLHYLNG
jgi:hypothetical protein